MVLCTAPELNLYVIKIMFKGKLTFMKTKDNNNSLNKMSCLISYRNSPDFKKKRELLDKKREILHITKTMSLVLFLFTKHK